MKKIILALITITVFSCQKEIEEEIQSFTNFNASEFSETTQADQINNQVNSFIIDDYQNKQSQSSTIVVNPLSESLVPEKEDPYLPTCVTRTVTSSGTTHTIELDFGTSGCTLNNGSIATGKITYSYVGAISANVKNITYTYSNFTYNEHAVSGSDTITYTRSNTNQNPEATTNIDLTINFKNGASATKKGTITTEWTKGSSTNATWKDDEFKITGNSTTTFTNGNTYKANITTALERKLNCSKIDTGVIDFDYKGILFSLDYGNGECDTVGIVTFANGATKTIIL